MRAAIVAAALLVAALPTQAQAPPQAEQCSTCHGPQGRSAMPGVPSLAGMPAEFITLQMILFREGLRDAPPMPQFAAGLTDADIEALAGHYAAMPPGPPEDRVPRNEALAARGAALAARMHCGSCHLPDFSGRAQMPRIAGQREEYLAEALRAYRDGRRVGTDTQMNAAMYGVSDGDIDALAHYAAHR
jgi:cytochrome c553